MVVWLLALGVTVAVGLVISSAISFWFALRQKDSLEELGVKTTYPGTSLPDDRIEAYSEVKEKLREQFAKGAQGQLWMSQLPAQAKDMLKYRLMQRAIGDMSCLQKIDSDARGYWKLFSKGIVTSKFWNSVLAAERELSQEIEAVKLEALAIEPTQDPQGIISEAMQFVVRYGDKMGDKGPHLPDVPAAANANALAAAAKAVAAAAGGMPRPPGAPPGPPLLPPGVGPPPGPPLPQQGGETDAYNWRQDTEEIEISVIVPDAATKAEVKVQFQQKSLKVMHCGKPLVEGQLAAPCCPEGCTWTLSKGQVVVTLEKASPKPWPSLFASAAKR